MLLEQIFEERRLRPFDGPLGRRPGFAQEAAEQGLGEAAGVGPIVREMLAVSETGSQIPSQNLGTSPPLFLAPFRLVIRARKVFDAVIISLNNSF